MNKAAATQKIRSNIPNAFTLTSLFLGFSAILACLQAVEEFLPGIANPAPERYLATAGLLIACATFLDMFDGAVARALHAESAFGRELDSLSDLVTFGIAPGVLFYTVTLFAGKRFGDVGIIYQVAGFVPVFLMQNLFIVKLLAFLFPICAGIRLARFNAGGGGEYFEGIPSTYAGGMMALAFSFTFFLTPFARLAEFIGYPVPAAAQTAVNLSQNIFQNFVFLLLLYISLAVLMVSRIPFAKLKLYFRPGGILHNKTVFGICIVLMLLFFKYFLFAFGLAYFLNNIYLKFAGRRYGETLMPLKAALRKKRK